MEEVIKTILYANLIPFLALMFFVILIFINPVFDRRQAKLFLATAFLNALMICAIAVNYIYVSSSADNAWVIRRITSFLNFAVSPVLPLLLYKIFVRRKNSIVVYLPVVLNFIVCFISIFSGIIFSINVENKYARGPLFIIPFLTTIGYLLLIIFKPDKSKLTSRRIERLFLFGIIGALFLMMFLEIEYGLSFLTWDVSCMGIVMYYLLLNIYQAIVDPLTGAYNRQMYNKALDALVKKGQGMIAFVDINNFKEVNDRFGHDVGDRYLIIFAETLNRNFYGFASLYRIGGDEFVLIAKKDNVKKFVLSLDKARKDAFENEIEFACGYKVYNKNQSIEEILKEADDLMYADKKQMKMN